MLIFIYTIIAILTITLLWIIERFLKWKWLKYVVATILLVVSLISLNSAYNIPSPDFEDLGEFVIGIYCLIVSILTFITSFIIDFVRSQKKKIRK